MLDHPPQPMKPFVAILAIVIASSFLMIFYFGKFIEKVLEPQDLKNAPSSPAAFSSSTAKDFNGPSAATTTAKSAASSRVGRPRQQATFYPPVFVGPSAQPSIIGPKGPPPG